MSGVWIGLVAVVAVYFLLSLKSSRPDGTLLSVKPYRRLMFFIMPTRNESIVFFDAYVDARRLIPYLEKAREQFNGNLTHCAVAACGIGLASTRQMNRFTVGRRLYQRNARWLTFSMKRRKTQDGFARRSSIATVKLDHQDGETFKAFCERINSDIRLNRSGKKTSTDQEFQLFNALPRPVLEPAARLVKWLDYNNLLPDFFIKGDPMFTSMFVANLGSLGMDDAFHHLYEYGTCPLFLTVGKLQDTVRVVDGKATVMPMVRLRFSYDERIADGLNARYGIEAVVRVLEEPDQWLGCVEADGSDTRPMWPRQDWESEDGAYMLRD
ncbi:MAG: 2-oxo acid dehydrogenase subunit E2 [Myxococcota bacterium]